MPSTRRPSRCVWPLRSTTASLSCGCRPSRRRRSFSRSPPIRSDWRLIAHNWTFEHAILEHVLIPRYGFRPIPLEIQHCSPTLALANAYPAELGLLAQALGLPYRKDPAARRAMLAVSRPKAQRKRKPGTFRSGTKIREASRLVYERCKLDVITTRAVFNSPKLERLTETERRYLARGRRDQRTRSPARSHARRRRDGAGVARADGDQSDPAGIDLRRDHLGQPERPFSRRHQRSRPFDDQHGQARRGASLGAQARRLCPPTARAAPGRGAGLRQQIQAHAGLRLAA